MLSNLNQKSASLTSTSLTPAVFLDRDGVLNKAIVKAGKPYAPREIKDFEIVPEAQGIVQAFKKAGFLVIVVTNQPDVGNGFVAQSVVEQMHQCLARNVLLDAIKVCYHPQVAGCACRKPKPGLLLDAAAEFKIDLQKSFMIGDRLGDVLAGQRAGCRSIFIDYGYIETAHQSEIQADFVVQTFTQASEIILKVVN